jgi:type II secretion system (T2SS) protein E
MVIAIERSARQLGVATADPLNVLALDELRRPLSRAHRPARR